MSRQPRHFVLCRDRLDALRRVSGEEVLGHDHRTHRLQCAVAKDATPQSEIVAPGAFDFRDMRDVEFGAGDFQHWNCVCGSHRISRSFPDSLDRVPLSRIAQIQHCATEFHSALQAILYTSSGYGIRTFPIFTTNTEVRRSRADSRAAVRSSPAPTGRAGYSQHAPARLFHIATGAAAT